MTRGVWQAVGAYGAWGLMPFYWKWLGSVPALQVISHRVVWSCFFLAGLVLARREAKGFRATAFAPRTLRVYALAALFIGLNWLIYIWAVQNNHIVDTSLGYFINPLLSILLGVFVLREKLRLGQWVAIALAAAGVLYLTFALGTVPWIALVLASSFAVYGFLKKTAPLNSIHGLALETWVLLPVALGYLLYVGRDGAFGQAGWGIDVLLIGAGVATTVPLLLFASAARSLPLAWLGILQFLAPTLQLLIGVIVYGEPMGSERLTGFLLVWLGLIIFGAEGVCAYRRKMNLRRLLPGLMLAAICIGGTACSSLPELKDRPVSQVIRDTAATRLGQAVAPAVNQNPGKSGVYPLWRGGDAFGARMLLTKAAESSIDVRYYIWRRDMSGMLLLSALREAAGRGVRVRMLLDDNNTAGLDPLLAALDAHPNVEIRLFNPFVNRGFRPLGYVTDLARLNRRMHNKSFTVDNQVTIVGGRNVGDEYFDAGNDFLFIDLDMLAVGPVVDEVSGDFDRYWASESAYPVAALLTSEGQRAPLPGTAETLTSNPAAAAYVSAIRNSAFIEKMLRRTLPFEWAHVSLISDPPAKALAGNEERSFFARLLERMGKPRKELLIVSPYFVPAERGSAYLSDLAARGVAVKVLTNSLQATDVAAVHAGYAKFRHALLSAGISLYELKPYTAHPERKWREMAGSSASSLHAKTMVADRARVMAGSFNFDPRSSLLNTEMALVIESPALANQIAQALEQRIPENTFEVRLSATGALQWVEHKNGQTQIHTAEPGISFGRQLALRFLALIPVEWL